MTGLGGAFKFASMLSKRKIREPLPLRVQRAVPKSDAVRHVEPMGDFDDVRCFVLLLVIDDRIGRSPIAIADVQNAGRAERHGTGASGTRA